MNPFCKICLAFVMLMSSCRRPPPPKVADEKKESVSRGDGFKIRPTERPLELQTSVPTRPVAKSKTAADWILVLKDTEAARRIEAAEALGKMAATGDLTVAGCQETAVAALLAVLGDDRSYVRRSAVEALSHFGAEAKSAVPDLIPKLAVGNDTAGNRGDP